MTKILVFPRSPSAGDSYGSGKSGWIWLTVGGNLFHCSKDWLYAGDSACLGSPAWGRIPGAVMDGLTSAERQRLKELERENRELRRSNDILRRSFRLFCEGGVRPPLEKWCHCWISCVSSTGSDRYAANCILPRQRITIVSNSDIIRINAVPVRSTMTGWRRDTARIRWKSSRCTVCVKSGVSCYGKESGWPDVRWHVSWRLWDLPVFSRVKGPYDHQPESRCRRRPRKPSVRGRTTWPAVGGWFCSRQHMAGLRLCGVYHWCVCRIHRGVAGLIVYGNDIRAGCAGAGVVGPSSVWHHPSQR